MTFNFKGLGFFNNEDDKKSPAEILYEPENKKVQEQKDKRNSLLNELGDKLTPAQILYSSVEKLEAIKNQENELNKPYENFDAKPDKNTTDKLDENTVNMLDEKFSEKPDENPERKAAKNFTTETSLDSQVPVKDEPKESSNSNDIFKKDDNIDDLNEDENILRRAGLSQNEFKEPENVNEGFERLVDFAGRRMQNAKNHPILSRPFKSRVLGPDTAGMLNLAEEINLPIYTRNSTELMNINDEKLYKYNNGDLTKFKSYIENKVLNQFKDFGYNLNEISGRIYNKDSAVAKRIKQSDDFKNALSENYDKIKNGESFSKTYTNHGFSKKSNLFNAFGTVDFLNAGKDSNGNIHLYMFDTYDFNRGENALVEAGRRQMLKGELKGFFTLHEIIISEKELEKYGKKSK